jgi:heat shock protein HslJ
MSRVALLWLAGFALVIAGCIGAGSKDPELTQQSGTLDSVCGNKWELKLLRVNGEAIAIEQHQRFTFLCNREGNVMGKSGINTYRGSMQVTENGQLLWDAASFASTKMAGEESLMQHETAYLRALAGTREAYLKAGGARLILRDASGGIYIEYVKVAQ